MTSPEVAFYIACLVFGEIAQVAELKLSSSLHQESGFLSAKAGDTLTLQCFYKDDPSAWLYWYKQTLGQKPRLISTFYMFHENGTFYDEFKNNPRFALDTGNGKNHLKIAYLQISDSATYYCASGYTFIFEFKEGTTVSVESSGLNIQTLVHQSASESIQPGGSVTLNCTVHTGSCDGGHRVYWFKQSEEPHPGLIYTHGDGNDQCERKPDTQTHTCVYNLPMENLNLSHAGTYYCAVASCGHILFGNGTKLDFDHEDFLALVYFLSGALAVSIILVVLLTFSVYKMNKRNRCQSPEPHARYLVPSSSNVEVNRDADNLHYAALSVGLPNRARRPRRHMQKECVYSSVKQ